MRLLAIVTVHYIVFANELYVALDCAVPLTREFRGTKIYFIYLFLFFLISNQSTLYSIS